MLGEIVMSQEWYCKRNVGLGRCQISVVECFVDHVQGSGAAWLFEIGGHASDGIYFEVSVTTAAKLFGCFKGGQSVLGGRVRAWCFVEVKRYGSLSVCCRLRSLRKSLLCVASRE